MSPAEHVYNVLLVSAAEKFNSALMPQFSRGRYETVTVADSISGARRLLVEKQYDLVIINAPLPDDFGRKLAIDVCSDSSKVAMLMVRSEAYDEIYHKMLPHGVMVARKPISNVVMEQMLDAMCSVRERLRRIDKKTVTLEEKMEEIRLVNRAKWALIKSCGMTEEDAHRYIQKQAMDLCLSKKETAVNIINTYN